jgi:hypothetical protein
VCRDKQTYQSCTYQGRSHGAGPPCWDVLDVDSFAGERVLAWCGPQPNSRLLINYGIVDETNPYDKVSILATLPTASMLFQAKRRLLETAGMVPCTAHVIVVRSVVQHRSMDAVSYA